MLIGLVALFLAQTWAVYTDPAGRADPPLSVVAARGQALWQAHNCQSCHQLYGFGGFLGPDLTNAMRNLSSERLDLVLTEGTEMMPAFAFDASQRVAMARFLEELGRTGEGQARAAEIVPPRRLLEDLVRSTATPESPLAEREAQGLALMLEGNCIDCHLPNLASAYAATDLGTMADRVGAQGLASTLASGVPGKAMPRFNFSPEQADSVFAVLTRMQRHGDMLRAGFERAAAATQGALVDLPWFEYPPVVDR